MGFGGGLTRDAHYCLIRGGGFSDDAHSYVSDGKIFGRFSVDFGAVQENILAIFSEFESPCVFWRHYFVFLVPASAHGVGKGVAACGFAMMVMNPTQLFGAAPRRGK